MSRYIGSIDAGTSSVRFLLFTDAGVVIDSHQIPLAVHHHPGHSGWAQQSPVEMIEAVHTCINTVTSRHADKRVDCIGITNQRESTIIWDSATGRPLYDSIVWHDNRTSGVCASLVEKYGTMNHWRDVTGLPISNYFSAFKLHWLLHHSDYDAEVDTDTDSGGVDEDVRRFRIPRALINKSLRNHTLRFGTVDCWLIWHLTGGANGGKHVTDVSNASRTCLMELNTCQWSRTIAEALSLPLSILPAIKSSSEVYGTIADGPLKGVPISGCLGDQQASLLGHLCVSRGDIKNTYGTGCFLLQNTGTEPILSQHGLLTTVAYQLGPNNPIHYALEGSIAVSGSAVSWLKDNFNIINKPSEVNDLAAQVNDSNGLYFVPAFSGLLSPYYNNGARGLMIGLTYNTTKHHWCRAVLEANAYQTAVIVRAMYEDSQLQCRALNVDGGLSHSEVLLQFQSDLLNTTVIKPSMIECTAAGAAFAAGLATGVWPNIEALTASVRQSRNVREFQSSMKDSERQRLMHGWQRAVQRSMDWVDDDTLNEERYQHTKHTSSGGSSKGSLPSKL